VAVYSLGIATGPTPSVVSLLLYALGTGGLYAAAGYFTVIRRYGLLSGMKKTGPLAGVQEGLSLQK
jgi:hypothetical protein